jgi:hypothetical protein
VRIKVSWDHIRNGIRGKTMQCPIALALNDLGFQVAVVRKSVIILGTQEVSHRIYPSEEMKNFIERFDNGERVYPKAFEIDVPGVGL